MPFLLTLSLFGFSSYIVYLLFIRQLFSPYKHLPTAEQPSLLRRLLHEPTTFELEHWMRETPNDGLVRYFGFLNQERLLMTELEIMKTVLQRESYKFSKLPWLSAVQNPAGVSGLVSSEGNLHRVHRKYTIAAFNSKSARELYPAIWRAVLTTSDTLFNKTTKSSSVKVNSLFRLATLHTAMNAAFSLEVDVLRNPEESLVKSYVRPFIRGERAPLYQKLLQICPVPLHYPAATLVSKCMGVNVSKMRSLVRKALQQRLEAMKREDDEKFLPTKAETATDVLESLLRRGHPHLSERSLLRHAMTAMAASTEMISNQVSWAVYAISHPRNMHVQERLRSEIRQVFPIPPDSLSWEQISSQSYLLGVVNEVLRLYPNVTHRSRVCKVATTLHDLQISKGTILTYPVYAMNRNPTYWGPEPEKFKPERWISENTQKPDSARRDAYTFMTFGQGWRKCPGEHYTRAVMACLLFGLIGRFEFRRVQGSADVIEDDCAKRVGFGIVMKAEIWADVREVDGWA